MYEVFKKLKATQCYINNLVSWNISVEREFWCKGCYIDTAEKCRQNILTSTERTAEGGKSF